MYLGELSSGDGALVVHHAGAGEGCPRALDVVDWQASPDSPPFFLRPWWQGELAPLQGTSASCRDVVITLVRGEYRSICWGLMDDAGMGQAGGHDVRVGCLLYAGTCMVIPVVIKPGAELLTGAVAAAHASEHGFSGCQGSSFSFGMRKLGSSYYGEFGTRSAHVPARALISANRVRSFMAAFWIASS